MLLAYQGFERGVATFYDLPGIPAYRTRRGEFVPAIDYARAYIGVGETERALQWLEKASHERNRFAAFIKVDPFYDPLRGDSRFEAIAKLRSLPN